MKKLCAIFAATLAIGALSAGCGEKRARPANAFDACVKADGNNPVSQLALWHSCAELELRRMYIASPDF